MVDEVKEKTTESNKRNLIIVFIILVLAIIGLTVGIIIVNLNNNTTVPIADNTETEIEETVTDELNEYIKTTDEEIKNAATDEEKATIYVTRAASIQNNFDQSDDPTIFQKQIESDLLAAEELVHSAGTAYNLYMYETKYGDESSATYYYDLAIERGYVEGEDRG